MMSNTSAVFTSIVLVFSICTMARSQHQKYHEAFDDGVPSYFTATRPESLSISPWHYKVGDGSLRWDWAAGEQLVIQHGIGDVTRLGGYRCRASFSVWVYMREPVADALVFEFREAETVTGSFRFPLEFTGWKQARPYYHAFPEGHPTSEVDNIRVLAPTEVRQGTVFLDFIKYNTLTYSSNAIDPEKEAQWTPPVPDDRRFTRPDQVTDAEMDGIRALLGPDGGPGIEQATVEELCGRVEALGIVRDEHGIRGPGIDAHYQYLSAPGEHGRNDVTYMSDESGPDWLGIQTPAAMSSLAYQIARAYRASNEPEQRRRLGEAYLLVSDHLHDQALQAASGFKWHWWVGGNWADAIFLMRNLLAETGRLQRHLDFLLYTYGGAIIFAEGNPPSHMDFYNLTVPRLLRQCLLQVEPVEQVRWLRAFSSMLDQSIVQPAGAFKVDGSAYHHAGHYHSYARGAFSSLPPLISDLAGTPWHLSAEAHERLRRAMLAQRLYANHLDLPIALKGRSPFAPGYGTINAGDIRALGELALCGRPDGTQPIDLEVAAAYLRFRPEAVGHEPYSTAGIEPEPHPNGTFVMPYAGLLCHRRDDWLAAVRGQSKYIWGSERQAQRNCHGLFQSLGSLEILAGGSPVTAEASGRSHHGWDWRHFEGTTVPKLPLDEIDQIWRTRGQVYSPEAFVGGLAHQGRAGTFAMVLHQPMSGPTRLTGRKSWFLSDETIICLGSGITCDEERYPTLTTLCQKALPADEHGQRLPTQIDGAEISQFPTELVLDRAQPHWFVDVQQTGYYLPAGQDVTVMRSSQTSRDFLDVSDTEGDFLTAWIDHGTAPEGAGYEYAVVVRATQQKLDQFLAEPPYRVIRQDNAAHIIRHTEPAVWSCVFFEPGEIDPHSVDADILPIREVDRPCIVMAESTSNTQLALSVADPDLNLVDGASQPLPLRIAVRGPWRLVEASETLCAWHRDTTPDEVRVVSSDAEETLIEIICRHAAGYTIMLTR